MPGNNQLVLCPLALCRIVERHLNQTQAHVNDPRIRVEGVTVKHDGGSVGHVFSVTTDQPPATSGAANA